MLAALVMWLSGCATTPSADNGPNLPALGNVGVVALTQAPQIAFEGFPHSKWQGAGRGALGTFGACLGGLMQGGCSGEFCGAVLILGLGVCGVAGVGGGVVGAVRAPWAEEAQAAEASLYGALATETIQAALRDKIVETARAGGAALVSVSAESERTAVELHDYRSLASAGVDTALEVALTRVGTRGGVINGPLRFYMQAQARLIRTSDNGEVFSSKYQFEGDERTLAEWSVDQARPLLFALQDGYANLAAQISGQMFRPQTKSSAMKDRAPSGAMGEPCRGLERRRRLIPAAAA